MNWDQINSSQAHDMKVFTSFCIFTVCCSYRVTSPLASLIDADSNSDWGYTYKRTPSNSAVQTLLGREYNFRYRWKDSRLFVTSSFTYLNCIINFSHNDRYASSYLLECFLWFWSLIKCNATYSHPKYHFQPINRIKQIRSVIGWT